MTSDASKDWVLSTLTDLRDFAMANGMVKTADKLSEVYDIAEAEIIDQELAAKRGRQSETDRRH